jgi:hypothetical protein
MNSEIDVNILASVYNEKIISLTSQNIVLEAKLKSLIKDFSEEKNKLLMANLELQRQIDVLSEESPSSKKTPKTETKDYVE